MAKISINLEVSDKLCAELLTTACEGGSTYWLACDSLKRKTFGEDDNIGWVVKVIGPVDAETDERFALKHALYDDGKDVGLSTVRLGIHRLLDGTVKIGNKEHLSWLLESICDADSCAWDADTADLVLQAGMFNEIVYG
jgi:hypothetical protein